MEAHLSDACGCRETCASTQYLPAERLVLHKFGNFFGNSCDGSRRRGSRPLATGRFANETTVRPPSSTTLHGATERLSGSVRFGVGQPRFWRPHPSQRGPTPLSNPEELDYGADPRTTLSARRSSRSRPIWRGQSVERVAAAAVQGSRFVENPEHGHPPLTWWTPPLGTIRLARACGFQGFDVDGHDV